MTEPTTAVDPAIHKHINRSQPNDRYNGPILPGQRWQSRGTGKHQHSQYTVLRFNGRSAQVVQEGAKHGGGKPFNIPEAAFRGNFNLIRQAPDYAPDPIADAVRQEAIERAAQAVTAAQDANLPGAPLWPDRRRPPGEVTRKVDLTMLDPMTLVGAVELLTVLEDNAKEQEREMLTQPAQPADPPPPPEPIVVRVPRPAPDPEPVVVAGEVVDYTVPLPGHENPLQGWIDQGQQLVARLTNELESVQHKITEQRRLLDALDGQHALLLGQRDQAEAAVLHAIALAEGQPLTSVKPPSSNADPAPPAVNAAGRPIGPGGRFVPPPGKVTQKEWVLSRLKLGQVLRIADLRDAFVTEYPMAPDVASQNISSILSYQLKKRDPAFPAIERAYPGAYRALA